MSVDAEITVQLWIKEGGMMVNTSAVDIEHPMHVYNQILAQGAIPEDYGYKHPLAEEFDAKSRGQLIQEIVKLRKEIDGYHRHSVMWN